MEGMVQIKQTKVVYTERESERGTRLQFVSFRPTPPSRVRVLYKQTYKRRKLATTPYLRFGRSRPGFNHVPSAQSQTRIIGHWAGASCF